MSVLGYRLSNWCSKTCWSPSQLAEHLIGEGFTDPMFVRVDRTVGVKAVRDAELLAGHLVQIMEGAAWPFSSTSVYSFYFAVEACLGLEAALSLLRGWSRDMLDQVAPGLSFEFAIDDDVLAPGPFGPFFEFAIDEGEDDENAV